MSPEIEGPTPPVVRAETGETLQREPNPARYPSLIQILVHPERYHRKIVTVVGFLRVEFEGDALYLSESDDRHVITQNAFWVSFEDNALRLSRQEIAEEFNGKWVMLEARFDKEDRGHRSLFQGTFKNILRLAPTLDRSRIDEDRNRRGLGISSPEACKERELSEPKQPKGEDPFAP